MTEISKLFTEIYHIDPSKLEMAFVNRDITLNQIETTKKYPRMDIPVFWAFYEEELIYGICNSYRFTMFESYDDWETKSDDFGDNYFDWVNPGEKELSKILEYNPQYFLVDPNVFLVKEIRDKICDWEMDIIAKWNRDRKINQLLQ